MDRELAQDRANDVGVENFWLRTFFREAFDGLWGTVSMLNK